MNRYLWIRFVVPLLLAVVALGGLAWWSGQRVEVDSSARTLLQSDPRNRETFEKIASLLPDTTFVMVAMEMENLFSDEGRDLVARASRAVLSVGGAVEVKSLTHSGRPVRKGFQLEIEPFFPRSATPEQWERIRAFTTDFPLSRNVMVSADGRYAVLVGLFERDVSDHAARESFRKEFHAAMKPFREETDAVHILSFPFIEAAGYNAVSRDLSRYAVFASVLVVAVLAVTFRSLPGVLLVLLLEALGGMILLGLFRMWGRPVDLYTGILFPLVGGLQLTFITHYLSALLEAGRTRTPSESAITAFREVIGPSLTAALTTIAGLSTLAFADLPTVNDFGRIGAVAIAAVFVATFILPACWGGFRVGASAGTPMAPTRHSRFPVRARLPILAGFAVFVCLLSPGIPRTRTDIRAMEFIEPGHPVRETLEVLNQDLGGTNIFQLRVDTGRPRGLQELPVLRYLEDLRAFAMELDGVSDAYAYSQLYVALDQIWEGDTQSSGELPTSAFKLNLYSNLLLNSPLLFKESFVDPEARAALMILRSRDMPGEEYLQRLETFVDHAEAEKPEGVDIEPLQGLHTILEGDRRIVANQSRTLGISLLVIAGLLTVLWRSPGQTGAVLLANLPALATIFGVMGYSGFPLNSITVMVAAVILGIAVDDGIHLVSAFRQLRRKGEPADEAAAVALRMKFRPMACTSSILAVFLGLLVLTSFPPVAHFGILSALGLATAFLGAILLLPALLGWRKERE